MSWHAVLSILFVLVFAPLSAPGDFEFQPTTDTYTWYDEPPADANPYRLDVPDLLPEFLDFVWVYTYEMYIKLGYSSTFAEIQAWSEWDECSSLFGCSNPSHALSKKMATAIKRAARHK